MTDISPQDHELIRRYLAGELAEAELTMLETRIIEDPVFRNEIDLTSAFRDGMRVLDSRGEIEVLLAKRGASKHRLQIAVAATLGAIALGLTTVLYIGRDESEPQVLTETLWFEPTRGVAPKADVVWKRNQDTSRLEMRFDVGPRPAGSYEVTVSRAGEAAASPLLSETITATADGQVMLLVDGAHFAPGFYEVRLVPGPGTAAGEPVNYTLLIN